MSELKFSLVLWTPTAAKHDKSRQESERETDRQSRAGVDGYGQFGSDKWEEMWVLELVTLVSFPKQQSRSLFLFYSRQNERLVLYCRQSGTDRSRRASRAQLDVKSPSRAGLLPHHPACSTGSMPGTPHCCCMPATLLLYSKTPLFSKNAMFTILHWNPLSQTRELVSGC